MIDTIDRYGLVLFLDGLGTKALSKERKDRVQTMESYNSFLKIVQTSIAENRDWLKKKFEHMMKDSRLVLFLTLVIIGSYDPSSRKPDKENRDLALISISGRVIAGMLIVAMDKGIFLRGCMSIGEFTKSLDTAHYMILGDPVNEAATHFELSEWMGVSATPSVHKIITAASKSPSYSKDWISHDLPLKTRIETSAWVINWPTYFKRPGETAMEVRRNLIKKRRQLIWKNSQDATDLVAAIKWRNTLRLFDKSTSTYVTRRGRRLIE